MNGTLTGESGTQAGVSVTTFVGRVGDRTGRAAAGAALLGGRLAERWGLVSRVVGRPEPALGRGWRAELDAAAGPLAALGAAVSDAVSPLVVMPRCAGALATLPSVSARRPDACVVWLDAHADVHVPETTGSGYLGGMALSGPLGWWDSGHGAGTRAAVLVGTRDIDLPEQQLMVDHGLPVVPPGADLARRLTDVVAGRPVYVHLDCDVLEPGIVPTEYRVPGGLDLATLAATASALARSCEIVGLEIAELEAPCSRVAMDALLDALAPLISVVADVS